MTVETEVAILPDERFWALVERAKADWEGFAVEVRKLSAPEAAGFAAMFWEFGTLFWQWVADQVDAYDDQAEDLGGRLIARGRAAFIEAIQDPSVLTAELLESLEGTGIDIMYEAQAAYREKTGRDFPAHTGEFFHIEQSPYAQMLSEELG